MPNVYTWLNREESKALKKRAQTYGMTEYGLLKELVLIELERAPRKEGIRAPRKERCHP